MADAHKILVPTDFSDQSAEAVRHAIEVAQLAQSELILLYVEESHSPVLNVLKSRSFPNLHDEVEKAARRELEDFQQKVIGDSYPVRTLMREGVPSEQVCLAAQEEHADLIIIATRGQGGFMHAILGSTTERVVRNAPCSVLVYKDSSRKPG